MCAECVHVRVDYFSVTTSSASAKRAFSCLRVAPTVCTSGMKGKFAKQKVASVPGTGMRFVNGAFNDFFARRFDFSKILKNLQNQ